MILAEIVHPNNTKEITVEIYDTFVSSRGQVVSIRTIDGTKIFPEVDYMGGCYYSNCTHVLPGHLHNIRHVESISISVESSEEVHHE